MRTIFYGAIVFVILQHPAYSIDRLKCGGTEPFWNAQLSDSQVVFDLAWRRAQNSLQCATLQGCRRHTSGLLS